MAESIIVHFQRASQAEVFALVGGSSEKVPGEDTYFLPNARYLLLIQEYKDYELEYDEELKKELESVLGCAPSFSLYMELRRSRQNAACDAAEKLIRERLMVHELAVDDGQRLWSIAEINSAKAREFLRSYRH